MLDSSTAHVSVRRELQPKRQECVRSTFHLTTSTFPVESFAVTTTAGFVVSVRTVSFVPSRLPFPAASVHPPAGTKALMSAPAAGMRKEESMLTHPRLVCVLSNKVEASIAAVYKVLTVVGGQ